MPPVRPYPLDRCDRFLARCKSRSRAIKVFATGDSWLAAPGGWWRGKSVVQLLNDDGWVQSVSPGHPGFNVLSIAKVGFEMKQMATDHDLVALDYVRSEFARQGVPFAFDAFMVSGGGNDVIPKVQAYIVGGDGEAHIDDARLDGILGEVVARWPALLARLVPGDAPVLANGYGPVIPTLEPGRSWLPLLGIGPWVGPWLLQHCGLDLDTARGLVADVIDRFNECLAKVGGIAYFDLRPTVAAMPASCWHDEIHFTAAGWKRVAEQWLHELERRVGREPQVGPALREVRMPTLAHVDATPTPRARRKTATPRRGRTRRPG